MNNTVNIVATHNQSSTSTEPVWRTKGGDMKMSEMSDKYLQNAFYSAQRSHKSYYDQKRFGFAKFFESKMNELKAEAAKRGSVLRCLSEINTDFINVLAPKVNATATV